MSRRNEERLGVKAPIVDSPDQSVVPQLNFTTPTEFVELPSKGKYYPEGHPLRGQDTVEIRYMTAKDEDTLTSKALIKKGVAIDRFLQNIIVDKNIRVDDLLLGDKNALIIAARITGYGSEYVAKVKCSCGEMIEHDFDLDNIQHRQHEVPEGAEETDDGTFLVKLPAINMIVELRLLVGGDEKALSMMAEKKKKHNLPESNQTDQFRLIIIGVEGHRDSSLVAQLIDAMPASDSKFLRRMYKKLTPNVNLVQEVKCEVCESVQEVSMPFTSDFFWAE